MEKKENLITNYTWLVERIARRIYERLPKGKVTLEDLLSAGYFGLIQAVERFDVSNPNHRIFLEMRIKGAIYDYLRSMDVLSKDRRRKYKKIVEIYDSLKSEDEIPDLSEIARILDMDEEEVRSLLIDGANAEMMSIFDPILRDEKEEELINIIASEEDIEEEIEKEELLKVLVKAFETLDDREKKLLSLYYFEGLPLKDVANILGISESRASQIHWRAVRKLREYMIKQGYIEEIECDKGISG